MPNPTNILIIGANGQLGTELSFELQKMHGYDHVIKTDLYLPRHKVNQEGVFCQLDVLDKDGLIEIIKRHNIKIIYHLAALLSASCEKKPLQGWQLNMDGLLNVLEVSHALKINRVFWPSSIAVFGPGSPKENTPQHCTKDPATVYGITKLAGERWCEYYFAKYGLDIRSIRYPGIIGYKSMPGGGTTDYAVDIFHKAIHHEPYECFLSENSYLPMMYMSDAIRATLQLMESDPQKLSVRSSYNISAMSFSPSEIYHEIKKHFPDFLCTFKPDFRQQLADSWPKSIDDSIARRDWNWKHEFDLEKMVADMILNLRV
ncbi:MAG: NAD-dependent epimerase [Bacteroidetes bacterium RIFCSPLOWO2_02_FULL_36_8]|nr:MAG: NAD-dependent epimerase [Bacteroidetes bacterium RIFCSPLOWO2_02_FULL_36_8]OFY69103.1 MAG: NAD-dependent epimerase [Bacteroidetes bacterium RIFCSPLOWO2_12_FULL_37_12]